MSTTRERWEAFRDLRWDPNMTSLQVLADFIIQEFDRLRDELKRPAAPNQRYDSRARCRKNSLVGSGIRCLLVDHHTGDCDFGDTTTVTAPFEPSRCMNVGIAEVVDTDGVKARIVVRCTLAACHNGYCDFKFESQAERPSEPALDIPAIRARAEHSIITARVDVPALCDEVERLRYEVRRLKRQVKFESGLVDHLTKDG